jgi:hypothetical protein
MATNIGRTFAAKLLVPLALIPSGAQLGNKLSMQDMLPSKMTATSSSTGAAGEIDRLIEEIRARAALPSEFTQSEAPVQLEQNDIDLSELVVGRPVPFKFIDTGDNSLLLDELVLTDDSWWGIE